MVSRGGAILDPQFNASSFVALGVGLAGLLLALLHIPRMFFDGTLSLGEAASFGVLVLVLSIGVIVCWGTALGYIIGGGLALACGALPYVQYRLGYRAVAAYAGREIAKWSKTLDFDPSNAGAHGYLAKSYVELGRFDEAVAHYLEAMRLSPHDMQVRHDYEIAMQAQRQRHGQVWLCPVCRAQNDAHVTRCFRCSSRLMRWELPAQPVLDCAALATAGVAFLCTVLALARIMSPGLAVAAIALASAIVFGLCYASGVTKDRE